MAKHFPRNIPMWGNDKIISNLKVRIDDTETKESEEVRLTAVLELRRGRQYRDDKGHRVMDIEIKSWTARGPSEMLDDNIELIVHSGKGQPKSHVVANQPDSDFPATMTFNVVSDMYVGDTLVAQNSKGQAINKSMMSVPPLGEDVFTVEKTAGEDAFIRFGKYSLKAEACFASIATLTPAQRRLFQLGYRMGFVEDDVYKKTMFLKAI